MRVMNMVLRGADAFFRRCWLAWRYVRALGYRPSVAWTKAARRG